MYSIVEGSARAAAPVCDSNAQPYPSIGQPERLVQLEVRDTETVKEAIGMSETELGAASNVDANDFNAYEHQLPQQTIDVPEGHLTQLKSHLNMLAPINMLPVELLIYILSLAKLSIKRKSHPFLSYTGVCRHWRSIMIQNPCFWTLVQGASIPFVYEVLRRSKSAQLDVIIENDSPNFISALSKLFAEERHRIRTLRLHAPGLARNIIQLALSENNFPSLRGLSLRGFMGPDKVFIMLLSVLTFSNHLESLECNLNSIDNIPLEHLTCIFGRLRSLNLVMPSVDTFESLYPFLCISSKLRNLRFSAYTAHGTVVTRMILPKLQFLSTSCPSLLQYFQTPKLSCFDTTWRRSSGTALDCRTLEEFDFSLIRCLYVVASGPGYHPFYKHLIIGSKELLQFGPGTVLTQAIDLLDLLIDIIFDTFPRNYFRIKSEFIEFSSPMGPALSWVLSRVQTNINELYLYPSSDYCYTPLGDILGRMVSVEKLVIEYRLKLLDFICFLSNISMLPRLKYLCYAPLTSSTIDPPEQYANVIGKALTECLQSRQKASVHQSKVIVLDYNYLPLPAFWLNELWKLGTKVATIRELRNLNANVAPSRPKMIDQLFTAFCQESDPASFDFIGHDNS